VRDKAHQEVAMIRVVTVTLLLLAGSMAAKSMEAASAQQLRDADLIRTGAQAASAAIASIDRAKASTYDPIAVVLQLSKAHRDVGSVKRGEIVWLVQVINRGASDLMPVPECLVWVRARDGAVARL
jgi:hypothetical protein